MSTKYNTKPASIFDIQQVPLINAPVVLTSSKPVASLSAASVSPIDVAFNKVKEATEKIVTHLRKHSAGKILHSHQIVEFIRLNNVGSPVSFEYVKGQNLIRGKQGNTIFEMEI